MTPKDDVFTAITPYGPVAVEFPEDGGCLMSGDAGAVAHLQDVMARNTNAEGVAMTPGNLEPVDLVNFCQPAGSGILVIEPFADLVRYGSMAGEEQPAVL